MVRCGPPSTVMQPARFAQLDHLPCFLDQRRRGGDADQFVRFTLGFGQVQIVVNTDIFDGGIIDNDIMAALTYHGCQIS